LEVEKEAGREAVALMLKCLGDHRAEFERLFKLSAWLFNSALLSALEADEPGIPSFPEGEA
jgi:hypothetical protein